jgi:hypothetical protein
MSTLSENVAKVEAAHAALKDAIAEKGVAVPEGTKLSGLPALIESIVIPETITCNHVEFSPASVVDEFDCNEPVVMSVANIISYDFMFRNCAAKKIIFPNDLPLGLSASAQQMFYQCDNLTSLTLPEGFGQNITNTNYMFTGCRALSTLTLPKGFGQNIKNASYMLNFCTSLASLTLPEGFGQNATSLVDTFLRCSSLTTITGNPNFKVSFRLSDCTKLTHDSLMVIINGLQTVTTAQTLELGETNLAKLTDEEKKVATERGWTLA